MDLHGTSPDDRDPVSVDAIDRLARICDEVEARGRVRVGDLAAELAVSEMTIRRDLDVLAEQGRVQQVHGGALALGPQRFSERYGMQARAKERVAAKLLALVPESGAVAMDASSTLQRLAASIPGARPSSRWRRTGSRPSARCGSARG